MLESAHQRLYRRRVQPVEVKNVGDSDGFEHDADRCEIGSLDFGRGKLGKFVLDMNLRIDSCLIGVFGVETEAVPIANTTCTTFSLHRSCLADRRDHQTLHPRSRIETVLFAES